MAGIFSSLTVKKISAWAPELEGLAENPTAWLEWAQGKREIPLTGDKPSLPYADPLFKRRLSQITRMTIEAVHGVFDAAPDSKLIFASFRGEIARQLKINQNLIENNEVLPAGFSISVFNTAPAATTIVLKMKAGYTAVFPGNSNFKDALLCAAAPVLAGSEKSIIFAYADELVPEEYKDVSFGVEKAPPLAFACVIEKDGEGICLSDECASEWTPQAFLKKLILAENK